MAPGRTTTWSVSPACPALSWPGATDPTKNERTPRITMNLFTLASFEGAQRCRKVAGSASRMFSSPSAMTPARSTVLACNASSVNPLRFQPFQQCVDLGRELDRWVRDFLSSAHVNVNIHAIVTKPERDVRLPLSQAVSPGTRHDQGPQRLTGPEGFVVPLYAHLRDQAADLRH